MKNTFVQLMKTAMLNSGRTRTRDELLWMSDRTLEDAGFSRALLMQGNNAWPWRIDSANAVLSTPTAVAQPSASSSRQERKAAEELRRLSNSELADIGITRGEIEQVVKNGRSGLDAAGLRSAA